MSSDQARIDFEQAAGESFGECVSPPVPFEDASPHECCEVLWMSLGRAFTPTTLAAVDDAKIKEIAQAFSSYFECEPPSNQQIKEAVDMLLARWPVGSLDEAGE